MEDTWIVEDALICIFSLSLSLSISISLYLYLSFSLFLSFSFFLSDVCRGYFFADVFVKNLEIFEVLYKSFYIILYKPY